MDSITVVFEGERVYDGEIFKLESTLKDYFILQKNGNRSLYTEEEINEASKKIINIQKVKNGYVNLSFGEEAG